MLQVWFFTDEEGTYKKMERGEPKVNLIVSCRLKWKAMS